MATQITESMIMALGGAYTLENVGKARRILAAAGVTDIELHPLEVERVRHHRAEQEAHRHLSETILAAGPLPPCTCTLKDDDSGLVAKTNGCKLGHRRDKLPDEVK